MIDSRGLSCEEQSDNGKYRMFFCIRKLFVQMNLRRNPDENYYGFCNTGYVKYEDSIYASKQ